MRATVQWGIGALGLGLQLLLVAASLHLLRAAAWALSQPRLAPADRPPGSDATPTPLVTVQLPLRNERDVAARLIAAAAGLDWPRLELQVLDDSDDETVSIVDAACERARAGGCVVEVVRRAGRVGYKAGALQHALATARGEYLLLLDADSQPPRDLVRRLVAALAADERLAFAQARWSFANERESLLTRVQAIILHALFVVEQARLTALGRPLQFNGTAGLWRRRALEAAGGWLPGDGASVTEDLDLSYRVTLAGFRGATLPEIAVDTELPSTMTAFRVQQERWVRGGAEVLRRLGGRVFAGSFRDGVGMLAHLARHARQPLLVALALWLPVVEMHRVQPRPAVPHAWPIVLAGVFVAIALYQGATLRRLGRPPWPALYLAPTVMVLSIGLAPALTRSLVAGLWTRRAEFVRTPKRGDASRSSYRPRRDPRVLFELALGFVHLAAAGWLVSVGAWLPALALVGLFALGLLWVAAG